MAALFHSLMETAKLRGEDPGDYLLRAALAAIEHLGTFTLPSGLGWRRRAPVGNPAHPRVLTTHGARRTAMIDTPTKRCLLRRLARLDSPRIKTLARLVALFLPGK